MRAEVKFCPACGAPWPATQFACGHCAQAIPDALCRLGEFSGEALRFDEALVIVSEALTALRQRPRPNAESAFLGGLRILLIIQTFGLILFFWKAPRQISRDEFLAEDARIQRQILQLRVACQGSSQLLERVRIPEEDLCALRRDFQRSLLIRNVCIVLGLGVYVSLVVMHRQGGG